MLVYSWQLTLVVWVTFLPLFFLLRFFQRRVAIAYGRVRERVGAMLGAVSESVVGATTVARTASSNAPQSASTRHRPAQAAATRAQRTVALTFSTGEIVAGLANASSSWWACARASTATSRSGSCSRSSSS
jgi:putative ABC transport system ATP-binding protein